MQNIMVLAQIHRRQLIEGISTGHFHNAMDDLMAGGMLAANRALFDAET